jgi:enoyl-CoA hydratase/carnithine racemase
MTKTLLNQELDTDFAAAIEAEAQGQAICMQTPAFRAAYEAFKARPGR